MMDQKSSWANSEACFCISHELRIGYKENEERRQKTKEVKEAENKV